MPSDHLLLQTQQTSARMVRKLWRLIAAVSTVLILSAPDTEASCGGYLYRQGRPVEHSRSVPNQSDLMMGVMDHTADATDRPLDQIPARRCSGPGCSESPFPLAPVSAPITLQRTADPGALIIPRATSPSALDGFLEVRSERIAGSEPAEVFRPPAA